MARRVTALALGALAALTASFAAGQGSLAADEPVFPVGTPPASASVVGERLAFSAARYRTPIFAGSTVTTLTYATRPDLVTGQPVTLRLDLHGPTGDSATSRPLLVWVHGGAFIFGNRSYLTSHSVAYARLGYVTATISYRLDPGSKCLQVQAGEFTGAQLVAERARCEQAMLAARDDTAAAIAYLRSHAVTYGIDTTRVAVGGFSAGAITAIHVGTSLNTPGNQAPAESRVSAVLAMSGCNYLPAAIDALDAPIAVVASGGDPLVPFSCSKATADAEFAVGLPAATLYYTHESLHADQLYGPHQAEIDRMWRLFLIDQLDL